MELTRDELWLLEVTVLNVLPVSLLFNQSLFVEEMNLPLPTSDVQDITGAIVSLCNGGFLNYEVWDNDGQTQPHDVQELKDRLETFLHDKPSNTFNSAVLDFEAYYSACGFVSITRSGGEFWERVAEPDWRHVLLRTASFDGSRTIHTFKALEKQTIIQALNQSGEHIIEETAEWKESRPWQLAWKIFDLGWALKTELRSNNLDPITRLGGGPHYIGDRRWYKNSVIFDR